MKKLFKLLVVSLVFSILVGCSSNGNSGNGSNAGGESNLIIGFNFDLSGVGASYGKAESNGAKLALKLFNEAGGFKGEEVSYKEYDNQSTESESYRVQTVLATDDKVFGIVGATLSGTTVSAVKASGEHKVPTISPSATADAVTNDGKKGRPYGYRVCFSDSFQGVTMANFASTNLEYKNVAILADNASDYAKGLTKFFTDQFKANGGTVIDTKYYVKGETDFNTVLTSVRGLNDLEAIFIPGYYEEVGLIIRQARELGITVPILGVDGFESPELIKLAGAENLNDVYYSNHYSASLDSPERAAFVEAYVAEYSHEPNGFAALAFDATNLMLDALVRADAPDPQKVNEAILTTQNLKTVTGSVSIDELHNAVKSAVVIKLENGVDTSSTLVNP